MQRFITVSMVCFLSGIWALISTDASASELAPVPTPQSQLGSPVPLSDDVTVGTNERAIVNGTAALDIPEHRAVVALHALALGGRLVTDPFCTGTLISDTVVLTAAHCLETNPLTGLAMNPSALAIYIGDDPAIDLAQNIYTVNEIAIHPDWNPLLLDNDIAIAVLDEPAPVAPVRPLPPVLSLSDANLGERLNFVGFGQDENDQAGVKLQTDGTLDGLGCTVTGCPFAGDSSTQLSYEMTDTGPCFGDSGGPAFVYRDGIPYLAGVTSYGDESCNLYGASTRVDAYAELLTQYLGEDIAAPSVNITSPANGDIVAGTATITVAASDEEAVVRLDLYIDGTLTDTRFAEPWQFTLANQLSTGEHTIEVIAYDSANQSSSAITILAEPGADSGTNPNTGGCSASPTAPPSWLLVLAIAGLAWRRQRQQVL